LFLLLFFIFYFFIFFYFFFYSCFFFLSLLFLLSFPFPPAFPFRSFPLSSYFLIILPFPLPLSLSPFFISPYFLTTPPDYAHPFRNNCKLCLLNSTEHEVQVLKKYDLNTYSGYSLCVSELPSYFNKVKVEVA